MSVSSALTTRESPRCVTRPVTTAETFRSTAAFSGSTSLALKRKTALRGRTARLGSCERLLMRLSVNPSLKYSLFGSAVTLAKGRTASESMLEPEPGTSQRYAPKPKPANARMATAAAVRKVFLWRAKRLTAICESEAAAAPEVEIPAAEGACTEAPDPLCAAIGEWIAERLGSGSRVNH